jgi:hypothetical protein
MSSASLVAASTGLMAFLLTLVPVAGPPAVQVARGGEPVAAPDRVVSPERIVSPDRIEDVATVRVDVDKFPGFDNFAWRAFIALNWPSLTDAAHRGVPDRAKPLGGPGLRVWETFKARYELLPVGADGGRIAPRRWATYDTANPCGAAIGGEAKTLASVIPFKDFNQPAGTIENPLVAQNRTYTRFETRVNEPFFSAFARNGWSQGRNLPGTEHPAQLPTGSIAVKAAWRILTPVDSPAVRARYYVVENANVVDVAQTVAARRVVCSRRDVALVGLHVVVRTPERPQGVWSTFEHVDNVPAVGQGEARPPDAGDAGAPYSYFDPSKPAVGLWPARGAPETFPVSLDNPPKVDPTPMQVVRRHPIHRSTMATNRAYWALPEIKGTVWEHYMLVATQWPSFARPVDPHNDGVFLPEKLGENLANTTMETYVQDPPSSCMSCHQGFNALGFDFVGTLASLRP